jgi:hypothetical protein
MHATYFIIQIPESLIALAFPENATQLSIFSELGKQMNS